MKYLTALLIYCAFVGHFLAPAWSTEKPSVKQLIARLASDDFEEREEASGLLADREDAISELQTALSSSDTEVRRRARIILDQIESRQAMRGLKKATSLLDSGEADQASERLVRWADQDPKGESLEAVMRFAGKLVQREQQQFGTIESKEFQYTPITDFATYEKLLHPVPLHTRQSFLNKEEPGVYLFRASGITGIPRCGGVIVSSGDVDVTDCSGAVIVATGSVILRGSRASIIVCDGDLTVRDIPSARLGSCIIVARGNVNLPSQASVSTCAIFAGGTVQRGQYCHCYKSVVREKEANALGLVKFFDPAKAGIDVIAAKDGVEVKTVGKGTAFTSAGVQPGDVLTAIGGKQVSSPENFRRLLRTALANGIPFTITARRSGKTQDFTIMIRD